MVRWALYLIYSTVKTIQQEKKFMSSQSPVKPDLIFIKKLKIIFYHNMTASICFNSVSEMDILFTMGTKIINYYLEYCRGVRWIVMLPTKGVSLINCNCVAQGLKKFVKKKAFQWRKKKPLFLVELHLNVYNAIHAIDCSSFASSKS